MPTALHAGPCRIFFFSYDDCCETRRRHAGRDDRINIFGKCMPLRREPSYGEDGGFCRRFTMIELMIVMIIIAILASSAVPIYRAAIGRAYETEVMTTLGVIRYTQRKYLVDHQQYAEDIDDLAVDEGDLPDMRYVRWENFSVEGDGTSFLAVWEGEIDGYPYSRVTMDQRGNIERME